MYYVNCKQVNIKEYTQEMKIGKIFGKITNKNIAAEKKFNK